MGSGYQAQHSIFSIRQIPLGPRQPISGANEPCCNATIAGEKLPLWVIFFRHAALMVTEGVPPTAERLAGSAGIGRLPPDSFRGGWV